MEIIKTPIAAFAGYDLRFFDLLVNSIFKCLLKGFVYCFTVVVNIVEVNIRAIFF